MLWIKWTEIFAFLLLILTLKRITRCEVNQLQRCVCNPVKHLRWSSLQKNSYRANIYLFKVDYRNTRKRCEICSKLTVKTPERLHWFKNELNVNCINVVMLLFFGCPTVIFSHYRGDSLTNPMLIAAFHLILTRRSPGTS